MVEAFGGSKYQGFVDSGVTGLLVPDRKLITSREIMDQFGFDFREETHRRLIEYGIDINREELNFLEEGKRHNGSDALYFLEQKVGEHRVYVSYIQEGGKSTRHKHSEEYKPSVVEIYDRMGGVLDLFIDDEKREGLTVVGPGHYHQIKQEKGHNVLSLIVLTNSAGIPDDKVHIAEQ